MKNLNKVLAMLVVFMMVVSTVAFAGTFTDVAESSSFNTAISVGTDMGLLKGYEDGTFAPEGEITRAEFAAVVVRMLGQEAQAEGAKASTMFTDVPAGHWAAGYINIAVQAGVVNGRGDGTFGPEDQVEYQDAITMMVRALGYEPAIGSAGYPTGYLTKAGELGLVKGVNGSNGVAINRGNVAQIAFNGLDVPLMTQSGYGTFTQYVVNDGFSATTGQGNVRKTLITENFNTVKIQGLVVDSSDKNASSTAKDSVNVKILSNTYNDKFNLIVDGAAGAPVNGYTMFAGNTSAMELVGKKVTAFVAYDEFNNEYTIKSIYEMPITNTLTIDLGDLESIAGQNITYIAENGKSQTVKFNGNRYYNGIPVADVVGAIADNNLSNYSGTIELAMLANAPGVDYDTMYVTVNLALVVDEVVTRASRVIFKAGDNGICGRISYDTTDSNVRSTLVDAKGAAMDWADLKENDVLSVKYVRVNGGKTIAEAKVIDNIVTGAVTATDAAESQIKIGDTFYDASATVMGDVRLGDEGTFYLSDSNKVIYVDTTSTKSDNYAYIISKSTFDGTSFGNNQVKLLLKDGSVAVYNIPKDVKYTATGADHSTKTEVVAGNYYTLFPDNTLVTVKVNSANEITAIEHADVINTLPTQATDDAFTVFYNNATKTMQAYKASNSSFIVDNTRLYLTDKTVIFSTAGDDSEVVALKNLADDDQLVNAKIYDIDSKTKTIGAIVIPTAGNEMTGDITNATFVTKIFDSTDEAGDDITYITGYNNLEEVTYTVVDSEFNGAYPVAGQLVLPIYASNGSVKQFNIIDRTMNSIAGKTKYTSKVGKITEVDSSTGELTFDGVAVNPVVSSKANIYVYNEKSNSRVKYEVGESLNYLGYDVQDGLYLDDVNKNLFVVAYLFMVENDVVDMVYYIEKDAAHVIGQPVSAAYNAGATVTPLAVNVVTSGATVTVTYKWQKKGATAFEDVAGATNATYTPALGAAGSSETYRCVISVDGTEFATSDEVTITVNQ